MKEDFEHVVERGDSPAECQGLATEEASPAITVIMRDGKAILTGTVRSWAEHQAAEQAAWAFPDVREIDDRLVVVRRGKREGHNVLTGPQRLPSAVPADSRARA